MNCFDDGMSKQLVVLIELLINFIQRNCDQIKSDFGGPRFSKIFDEVFSSRLSRRADGDLEIR